MKKFTITCTEEQLRLVANAVEDWSRFLCGQCEMENAASLLDTYRELKDKLHDEVHPLVAPELPLNASYGWSGGDCANKHQKKAIAMSYGIYREIRHFFALRNNSDSWNVYRGETLRCEEQGPLIQIEEV